MLSYIAWNEAIFHHFFNETKSGRGVSLALDSDELSEIAGGRLDSPHSAEEELAQLVFCSEERCAWWNSKKGCCAILSIVKNGEEKRYPSQ